MAAKKWNHPPVCGPYDHPNTVHPDYFSGKGGLAGFGGASFFVAAIPRTLACDVIIQNHYSHRIVNNSYVHLGVFIDGKMVGVMQYGYALMPANMGWLVTGSASTDYLELNRMWLDDSAPRNSESRAIAYSIRYIKRAMPQVGWIQSFADERCGGWGVVYQAANFLYVGSHKTHFYELDGQVYHDMLLTAHGKSGQRGVYLRANLDRARRMTCRQFRYIFFVRRGWHRRLTQKVLPYPKRHAVDQENERQTGKGAARF